MINLRWFDDRGAGFTEYALLVAFIAATVFVAIIAFGGGTSSLFDAASSQVLP